MKQSGFNKKQEWGDDEDDEDYETPVDEKTGIKQRVTTSVNSKGQKVRTTMKIKVYEKKIKIPKRVLARRNLPKFGEVNDDDTNVTLLSKEFIQLEHPDDINAENADEPGIGSTLSNFILKQQERALEREIDMEGLLNETDNPSTVPAVQSREEEEKEDSKPQTGKYVARGPVKAGGSGLDNAFKSGSDRDNENTIRVSNLTKAATEEDLRALFEPFGRILRVSLPRVERMENGKPVKETRGFAYIAFLNHDDAAMAMERLQGHGYDHLILKLEWAKPPSRDANAPPSGGGLDRGFTSGYGQKLAQDTKEQVMYASNLTGNR